MKIRGLFQNPKFLRAMIIAGGLTIIFLVCNIFVIGGDRVFEISNTLLSPTAALIAAFLFYQASANKRDTVSRFMWLMMAWGFGLWGLADVIWAFYALVLNDTVPYPSVADVIWAIGYIPLFIALLSRLRTLKITPSKRQIHIIIGLNMIWLVLALVFIMVPIVRDFDPTRLLEGFFNVIYPLSDIGLVFLSSLILILLKEGRFSPIWRLIFSGIFIMTVSDLLFAYATWHVLYYPDGLVNPMTILVDTTYTLAYISAGLGIYMYQFIWDIEEKFVIDIQTLPKTRYYAFVSTNQANQLIAVSDNFFCLINGQADADYYKWTLDEALGLPPGTSQVWEERLKHENLLCNEHVSIMTQDHKEREAWLSAIAIISPEREYVGANFAWSANIPVSEDLSLPKSKELRGMLNYLLSLVGSSPQDEILTMRVYFQEVIRLFSSMLYQFGGSQFRSALFEVLDQTILRKNLPVKIDGQVISLPDIEEGKELAASLVPLLQEAKRFATEIIGEQIVKGDIEELEKPLSPANRKDLDKYQLRLFCAG